MVSALTIDEICEAHLEDVECKEARRPLASGEYAQYKEDQRSLLAQIADIDGAVQTLIPLKLRKRVLFLTHYTPLAGHPGITKQF